MRISVKNGVHKINFGKCINSFTPLGDDIVQLRNHVFIEFFLKDRLVLELIPFNVDNWDQVKSVLQEEV